VSTPWTDGAATAAHNGDEPGVRPRPRPAATGALTVFVAPLLLFLAVAIASTPWLRAYQVGGAEGYLTAAALAPVIIGMLLGERLRQPPVVSYGASLVGLVALVLILGGGDPASAWHGLSRDPTRLLTETLPLAGRPELLIAPAVLTWIAAAATCELWVRTRASAVALVVPLSLFVVAFAATSAAPGNDPIGGPLLLGVLALAAVVRHRQAEASRDVLDVSTDNGSPGRRTQAGTYTPGLRATSIGAALAVVVAAVLGVGIHALPALRSHPAALARPTPKTSGLLVDPVDAIASLRNSQPHGPAQPQFTVTTNRPAPGYFGVAALDDYNGGSWTFDTTFEPSGGRIPPAPAGTPGATGKTTTRAVSQQFRFEPTYALPFVPVLDRPLQVRGMTIAADAQTGMILPAEAGSVPGGFSALSQAPATTLEGLPAADEIGTGSGALNPVELADTSIPIGTATDIGAATRFLAALTGDRPAPTLAFLQAVDHALATRERRIDPSITRPGGQDSADASGGTSLAEVLNAVAVVKAATPEQFATFFVMVARYLGVPARLVTGFRVPAAGGGPGILAAGEHLVTNRDAWTWAEIPVAGVGWVIADPTPVATVAAAAAPPEQVHARPTPPPPHQANAVPQTQILGGHAIAKPIRLKSPDHTHHSRLTEVLLALVSLAVAILLAGPGLAGLRRLARRRARRRSDPKARTVGAWLELLDGLNRYGMPTPETATTAEVATSAGHHFGENVVAPIEEVGALADRALFSLADPPDAGNAARAWRITDEVRHEVAGTLDRRQRARALLGVGDAPRRPVGAKR
jgi:transglutaminase-like putative cysteine protease